MTSTTIAMQMEDGTIKVVPVSSDGFLSHTGKILVEHYKNPSIVQELLSRGEITTLGKYIGDPWEDEDATVFYADDFKDDPDVTDEDIFGRVVVYKNLDEYDANEAGYIFINDVWYYSNLSTPRERVGDLLEKEGQEDECSSAQPPWYGNDSDMILERIERQIEFLKEELAYLIKDRDKIKQSISFYSPNSVAKSDSPELSSSDEWSGMTFVLTGELKSMTRSKAIEFIENRGGKTSNSVSKNTSIIISGNAPGSKLDKALKLGITVWSEDDFAEAVQKSK